VRILLAPDKFRGTFTASEVCHHLARGLAQEAPGIVAESLPLADGGEGMLEAVLKSTGGTRVTVPIRGPMDEEIACEYGVTPDGTAVIESARACGLQLVPAEARDPMSASSYGLGQVVAAALDAGIRRFLIGLGGTATVDGGAGMARALGIRLEDEAGRDVGYRPRDLWQTARVDASMAHPELAVSGFVALCDVANPLLGPKGAARVFGPQKGASGAQVERLEAGLAAVASAVTRWKTEEAGHLTLQPGAGAGGGLGAGCAAFLGARLRPGAPQMLEMLSFEEKLSGSDLAVTGEGSFDSQTAGGKVVAAVLEACVKAGKPVVVVAGRWDGTLPAVHPGDMEVLTGEKIGLRSSQLDAGGLAAAGQWIARRALRLAKPCEG
jgi:glycerate 2-kinase